MSDTRKLTGDEVTELMASREGARTPEPRRPDYCSEFHDAASNNIRTMFKHQHLMWLAQWAVEFCRENDIDPTQISLEELTHAAPDNP